MEVKKRKVFEGKSHYSIEWGYATWSKHEDEKNKDWSIRNRYDKDDGGYNHTGSKELPWIDFNRMILTSINENQFLKKELKAIIFKSLKRVIKNLFK